MNAATLEKQVEELQMIRCSLLPGEIMTFLEDICFWDNLFEIHSTSSAFPDQLPAYQAHFLIKVDAVDIWFEVLFPFQYIGNLESCCPTISVKGHYLGRDEQEKLQKTVEGGINEYVGSEYPMYQLISAQLLPLLHTMHEVRSDLEPGNERNLAKVGADSSQYHALLTSHHLISPNKRRSLQQWSGSLSIKGFAKVGYPGVIYAYGAQECIEEFVADVKAMQWLALKIRFVEPIMGEVGDKGPGRQWAEFHKVGEVVEEMRRLGRERFLVEMGIGSLGTER